MITPVRWLFVREDNTHYGWTQDQDMQADFHTYEVRPVDGGSTWAGFSIDHDHGSICCETSDHATPHQARREIEEIETGYLDDLL